MNNMTVFKWLIKNHPEIYQLWLKFQTEWRKTKIKKYYKNSYKPTGRKPGRPKKNPLN